MNLGSLCSFIMYRISKGILQILFLNIEQTKSKTKLSQKKKKKNLLEEPNFCVLFYYIIILLCKERLYREITNSKLVF